MAPLQQTTIDTDAAMAGLAAVTRGLDSDACLLRSRPVPGAHVPEPFRRLLVHEAHMTTTLNAYYGGAVGLEVLESREHGDLYDRRILLRVPDGRVVEYGIARLRLDLIATSIRNEILARQRPLGDILISYDVLRRIEPQWFFEIHLGAACLKHFDVGVEGGAFGRVGRIHCDGEPAIELLEVVVDAKGANRGA